MQWYALQTITNHERKAKQKIEQIMSNGFIEGRVFIPTDLGKPAMPGYMFIQCETWPLFLPYGIRVIGEFVRL